jgi:hypothetical protein
MLLLPVMILSPMLVKFQTDIVPRLVTLDTIDKCRFKRLLAESKWWANSDYLLLNYQITPDVVELTFRVGGSQIVARLPKAYPFKGPDYFINTVTHPNHKLASLICNRNSIPLELRRSITSWLAVSSQDSLKRYLYHQYHPVQNPVAITMVEEYGSKLSPYVWGAGTRLDQQLSIIQGYLHQLRIATP